MRHRNKKLRLVFISVLKKIVITRCKLFYVIIKKKHFSCYCHFCFDKHINTHSKAINLITLENTEKLEIVNMFEMKTNIPRHNHFFELSTFL